MKKPTLHKRPTIKIAKGQQEQETGTYGERKQYAPIAPRDQQPSLKSPGVPPRTKTPHANAMGM